MPHRRNDEAAQVEELNQLIREKQQREADEAYAEKMRDLAKGAA